MCIVTKCRFYFQDKCRPHVLRIIHSMTDEGVKKATETVE